MSDHHHPGKEFEDRAKVYQASRPRYPAELGALLTGKAGWSKATCVIDVGAGTGLSTELLLSSLPDCTRILAVEPSADMLNMLQTSLSEPIANGRLSTVRSDGETLLGVQDSSVDAVSIAQAFHWMNPEATRAALQRVLSKNDGVEWPICLYWNRRDTVSEEGATLEAIVQKHCPEYLKVNHLNITAQDSGVFDRFFGNPEAFTRVELTNSQAVDFAGLCGRMLSTSYSPRENSAEWPAFRDDLRAWFDTYASVDAGLVHLQYNLLVVLGRFC